LDRVPDNQYENIISRYLNDTSKGGAEPTPPVEDEPEDELPLWEGNDFA